MSGCENSNCKCAESESGNMKSLESTINSAEERADNVQFLCAMSIRRFDCIIRSAKQLKLKIKEVIVNE